MATESQAHTFKAAISFDDLLKDALRFRPDRIIILGEVRGVGARTLLDSLNTGHARSLATIHANSAVKALRRFANRRAMKTSKPRLAKRSITSSISNGNLGAAWLARCSA